MQKCEITVYIPTHNRVLLLKRAVDSVLSQTFQDFELIVINDGSDIETASYLKALSQKDSRVSYRLFKESRGACSARNEAISLARGKYITGLDDDDYYKSDHLESFYRKRCLLDKYSFLSCSTIFFDHDKTCSIGFNKRTIITKNVLLKYNAVGNQVFTLTSRFLNVDGFDEKLKAWQDYDMWLRLVLRFGHGYNIKYPSYFMDVSDRDDRISLSKNKAKGMAFFIEKHNAILSDLFKVRYHAMIFVQGHDLPYPYNKGFLGCVFFVYKYFYRYKMSRK